MQASIVDKRVKTVENERYTDIYTCTTVISGLCDRVFTVTKLML